MENTIEAQNKIINIIARKSKELCFSRVLILSGSARKNKTVDNVDLLLITNKNISDKNIFKIINKKYFIKTYKNCHTFNIKNILFNITIMDIQEFDFYFNEIVVRKKIEPSYRNWCLGYFIPEAFLGDLKNSKIIFEKIDFNQKYRNKLIKYPQKIKSELIQSTLNDLEIKEKLFNKAFKKKDLILIVSAISDIFFISFRALSANKEVYFGGLFSYKEILENYPELQLLVKEIKKNISNKKRLNILVGNYLKEVRKLLN